jgi:hypothetical protein
VRLKLPGSVRKSVLRSLERMGISALQLFPDLIVRENRKQLASWAAGALARLPERVRQHPEASMLAQAVKASGVSSVPGFESTAAPPSWMTPVPPPVFTVGLRLYPDRLEFRMPPVPGDTFGARRAAERLC